MSQADLRHELLEILDVILDQLIRARVPRGIAMTSHVERDDVEVGRERRGDMVERVCNTADAVPDHERRFLSPDNEGAARSR